MEQTTQPGDPARAFRIIHLGLIIGLVIVGALFFALLRMRGPILANPIAGFVPAAVALVLLGAAFGVLRPRVPVRRPDQSSAAYWLGGDARTSAFLLWTIVDAAGMAAWVGYFLSGQIAAAVVALIAIAALIVFQPSRLENRGAD